MSLPHHNRTSLQGSGYCSICFEAAYHLDIKCQLSHSSLGKKGDQDSGYMILAVGLQTFEFQPAASPSDDDSSTEFTAPDDISYDTPDDISADAPSYVVFGPIPSDVFEVPDTAEIVPPQAPGPSEDDAAATMVESPLPEEGNVYSPDQSPPATEIISPSSSTVSPLPDQGQSQAVPIQCAATYILDNSWSPSGSLVQQSANFYLTNLGDDVVNVPYDVSISVEGVVAAPNTW